MACSQNVLVLVALSGCISSDDEPVMEPCGVKVAGGELDSSSKLLADSSSIWATDSRGMLLQAPLGDGVSPLADFTYVGRAVDRIVDDELDLWIDAEYGAGLLRVDKATAAVEIVDNAFRGAFAIDDLYVYWVSHSFEIKRRPKRGGEVETIVEPTDAGTPYSLVAAGGRLYDVNTDGHQAQIHVFDFASRSVRSVATGPVDGSLDLIGPDDNGRLYQVRVTHRADGDTTSIHQWSEIADTELVSWNGNGIHSPSAFAQASDGLYLAVPDLAIAFLHFAPDGGRPTTLAEYYVADFDFGNRFTVGPDGPYVTDRHSIYRLPATGGPYSLCAP
jgi:hypothetical protein